MDDFEYNAPKFVDFESGFDDSDGADTFFDVESGESVSNSIDENKENAPNEVFMSPIAQKTPKPAVSEKKSKLKAPSPQNVQNPSIAIATCDTSSNVKLRPILKAHRRLSDIKEGGTQEKLSDKLSQVMIDKLSLKAPKRTQFDGIEIEVKKEKPHTMTTRRDQAAKTPTIELRTRVVNKEEGVNRKRKSELPAPVAEKYMAMAERILHFQKDTPPRFHTNRRRSSIGKQDQRKSLWKARQSYNPQRTIPHTPKLMTNKRVRPSMVLSQKDREEMELEEMKKHQVKAHPLNEKIFKEPKPLQKAVKPKTVQEPFNLTQTFKKPDPKPAEEPFHFTAKPAPKVILKRAVGVGPKPELPVTVPQSPAITKPKRVKVTTVTNEGLETTDELTDMGVPYSKSNLGRTVVKPFSFEVRDREMRERREKKIQEILEAEKRAREFKANPKPAFRVPRETNRSSRFNHLDSSKASSVASSCFSEDQNIAVPFKARSPRVLRKPKFEVVLPHSHSQPLDIKLRTDLRAKEREVFEIMQAEKEERITIMRAEIEEEKKRREEEEIARIRRETVHKAQPMPKYPERRPKVPTGIPLTTPHSPRFTKRVRQSVPCNKVTSTSGNN